MRIQSSKSRKKILSKAEVFPIPGQQNAPKRLKSDPLVLVSIMTCFMMFN